MQSSGMLLDTITCFQSPPWLMGFVIAGFAIQESSKRKQNSIKMESALQNTNSCPFRPKIVLVHWIVILANLVKFHTPNCN